MEIEILKKVGCPEWVIMHSQAVCKKALEISEYYPEADKELIRKGALLHDIGRSKSNKIDHAYIGGEIAKELNYSKEVINIIERHIGTGISKEESKNMDIPTKDYIPITLEEKIVSHADNLLNGSDEVTIEFTANKWRKKLGENHPSINKLYQNHEELIKSKESKKQ
jgi:uncharacterized protein